MAVEEEDCEEGGRGDCDSLLTDTPVQSPQVTSPSSSVGRGSFIDSRRQSCNSAQSEQADNSCSPRTPVMVTRSPQALQAGIEPERFKKAAEVLCRHYGGGSFREEIRPSPSSHHFTTQYFFSEDEEEIKI